MVLEKLVNKKNRLGFPKTWEIILEPEDPRKCDKCGSVFEINKFIRYEFDNRKNLTGRFFCYSCSEENQIPGRLGLVVNITGDSEHEE